MRLLYGVIWLICFLIIGVLIVGIGGIFEEPSSDGMLAIYMIGYLLGTMITAWIKEKDINLAIPAQEDKDGNIHRKNK